MHALLFRKWKQRIKGRDWYDMEWYIRKGIPLNVSHFLQRAKDTGDWTDDTITKEQILDLLRQKINTISVELVQADVIRFISDDTKITIWSKSYFLDLIEQLMFED
jgi:hypothetical protein